MRFVYLSRKERCSSRKPGGWVPSVEVSERHKSAFVWVWIMHCTENPLASKKNRFMISARWKAWRVRWFSHSVNQHATLWNCKLSNMMVRACSTVGAMQIQLSLFGSKTRPGSANCPIMGKYSMEAPNASAWI
jgi:hypothetical protein